MIPRMQQSPQVVDECSPSNMIPQRRMAGKGWRLIQVLALWHSPGIIMIRALRVRPDGQ